MDAPLVKPPKARALLAWYDKHQRAMPWRALPGEVVDPYRVWLSEIMLQQTTVATVGPYFESFLKRWPTLQALAAANEEDVLHEWAGLGYYSRARNLKKCAEVLVEEWGGAFPTTASELQALPGIGPYTSAAIAAIAFDRQETVVDGNVERVISRLYRIESPLPKSKPEIKERASDLTSPSRPGDYAQAIMDLGATICRPRSPDCHRCPWEKNCLARAIGDAESFPKKEKKKPKPIRRADILYLVDGQGRLLMRQRPDKGLLASMWELPSSPWMEGGSFKDEPGFDLCDFLKRPPKLKVSMLPVEVKHTFTHFHQIFRVWMSASEKDLQAKDGLFLTPEEIAAKPVPTIMAKVIEAAKRT